MKRPSSSSSARNDDSPLKKPKLTAQNEPAVDEQWVKVEKRKAKKAKKSDAKLDVCVFHFLPLELARLTESHTGYISPILLLKFRDSQAQGCCQY